tara:strand:+ start:3665 stop:5254 length:1590 start_codon:yes stop_codon:yes gene_type:complete
MVYIPIRTVAMPHYYGKLISDLKKNGLTNAKKYLIYLIIVWSIVQFVKVLSNHFNSKILPKFLSYVRDKIVDTIIDRYKTNYEDLKMGDTITKIIKAPWLLDDIFDTFEDFIFRHILLIGSSFVYLSYYNNKLGLLFLLCVIVIFLCCWFYIKECESLVKKSEVNYDVAHEEIEDTLSNLISVYTSHKTKFEKERIEKLNKNVYISEKKVMECNNKYKSIFAVICIIIFIVLNFYSLRIYKSKEIKLDILIAIIIINYSILSYLMAIFYYSKRLTNLLGRIDVFKKYLDSLPHSSKDNILKISNSKNIIIKFKNISFSYVPEKKILDNLNLTIKSGDVIGLIGHIGSGKSTIAKLLVRLKEPQNGNITINGLNINKLNLDNLRYNINYIPQHPKLFNRTLFSNILYGVTKKITVKDINNIIKDIGVNNVSEKFNKMMFEKVGKNGSKLSGGQRQLVWLIRSVLKDSKVIILDEPTSSMDEKSKEQTIKFIKKFSKDKIIILITHDNSLLKEVNRIIELKNGKIIQDKQN